MNVKRADYGTINEKLSNINWENILTSSDTNNLINKFYIVIDKLINTHVPSFTVKGNFPAYFKPDTIKTIKNKNIYHKKYKKFNSVEYYNIFSQLRTLSKQLIRRDYTDFVNGMEVEILNNNKTFWNYVSSKKKTQTSIPGIVHYGDRVASTGQDICNSFADFFKSVYVPTTVSSCPVSFYPDRPIKINNNIILDLINRLELKKGAGPDRIPPIFIKSCKENLVYPLRIIYESSLKNGIFPEKWKISHIIPIFKSGQKNDVANYRPISKICIFAKIFEKIIYTDIMSTVKTVIIDQQHGFFPGRSLETNLMCYSQNICSLMDRGVQVDSVYTDFSKAFDKINHKRLIERLAEVGVCQGLLRWVWSYISNRSQIVSVNGFQSNTFSVSSGVPQGSHLGPLFFIIYINDIAKCFHHTMFLLYADDLKIYRPIRELDDCLKIQADLNRLSEYCDRNSVFLNITKCCFITFTKNIYTWEYPYNINNSVLKKVDHIKDLGVILDTKWLFQEHFNKIISESNKMLGFINRICRDFRNPKTLISLYFAFVHSKLSFASIIWNPQYVTYINRLEAVQNRFLKTIAFKAHCTIDLAREKYKLIALSDRRKISDMSFLYKLVNSNFNVPDLLSALNFNIPSRELRHPTLFNLPYRRTNLGLNTPLDRLQKTFNSFCHDFDIFGTTFFSFKSHLKIHFVRQEFG